MKAAGRAKEKFAFLSIVQILQVLQVLETIAVTLKIKPFPIRIFFPRKTIQLYTDLINVLSCSLLRVYSLCLKPYTCDRLFCPEMVDLFLRRHLLSPFKFILSQR